MSKPSTQPAPSGRSSDARVQTVINTVRPTTPMPPERLSVTTIRRLETTGASGESKKGK